MIITKNPYTLENIAEYTEDNAQIVETKINAAFLRSKESNFSQLHSRLEKLSRAAEILRKNKQIYAEIMTQEMGKPISQSISEIEKCAWVCDYYVENAENMLQNEQFSTEFTKSYAAFRPLGVVLAVMPWNFPFWQVFRFAAPALSAGNICLLKHASNTMGSALAIQSIFDEAFGEGYFTSLILSSSNMRGIIEDPRISALTLTGSTPAGKKVASTAAAHLKKTVLELGGSDPYIVLNDADLDAAAEACATARMINSGQSCIAAKRFIVENGVYDEFSDKLALHLSAYTIANPMSPDTKLGPLARKDLLDDIQRQVRESISAGAVSLIGGKIPDLHGYFYPATLLKNVTPGMPVFDEETFAPVAAVIKANDENNAIELANQSPFGLGAAIFTSDIDKGEFIAREKLNAGCCFVNQFVKSDPRLPFGGIKESGYGRELSAYGMKEFLNIKIVVVK